MGVTIMNTPEKVYRQFCEFEEKAAAIYTQFAARFAHDQQLGSFWLDMAMHEKQHAGLLQFCLCEGMFTPDLPDPAETEKFTTLFESLERRARDPNLTIEQAFSIAVELEASEINAIYCRLTVPLHKSMYLLRRKIATMVPNHIDELIESARKFGVGETALDGLRHVKVQCEERWHP
jgi:hypothetical protein